MFKELLWIKEALEESHEDFEEVVELLAAAELIGALEVVENLMSGIEEWADKVPKQNMIAALSRVRNDVLEELRNIVAEKPFFLAAIGELVKTPLTEKVREEARKALEKKEEVKTMTIEEGD